MKSSQIGDAFSFFFFALWSTRHSEEHIVELEGLPVPPWLMPWLVIGMYTAVQHPAWEEVMGIAVAYALELWRYKNKMEMFDQKLTCRISAGISLFLIVRYPHRSYLLGTISFLLHSVAHQQLTHPRKVKPRLLDFLLLAVEAFDIFAISWHDLRSDHHLLLQRGLSAITVSGVCGQRVSWSIIALLGIQIAVGDHTGRFDEVLCKVLSWLAVLAMVHGRSVRTIEIEFCQLDTNSDGEISWQELERRHSSEVADAVFGVADKSGSVRMGSRLSRSEFNAA